MRWVVFLCAVWVVLLPVLAAAQSHQLDIRSDSLNIDNSSEHAIFEGSVVVVHRGMTLNADKVDVFYAEAEGGRVVEEIRAEGSVRLERGQRTATGKRAVYRPEDEEVALYEDVVVQQGDSQTLYGTTMRYDMVAGRMSLTSDTKRVRARLGAEDE